MINLQQLINSEFGVNPTTSTVTDNSEGLTFEKLIKSIQEINDRYKVVYYMASEYVPVREDGQIICMDNNGATPLGYDVICNTSQLKDVIRTLNDGFFIPRPLDNYEVRRRLTKGIRFRDGTEKRT